MERIQITLRLPKDLVDKLDQQIKEQGWYQTRQDIIKAILFQNV